MDNYYHEIVEHRNKIPGLIAFLDDELIKRYFPSDVFVPTHWHRSLEITLIENAEVALQIGEEETLISDDFTCVNSGAVHSLRAKKLTKDSTFIIVLISYDFIKAFIPQIDDIYFDLKINTDHRLLKDKYYQLKELYLHQDEFTYLQINACLLEILNLLLKNYQVPKHLVKAKSLKAQDQIKMVLSYIHEHYQEDLSLNKMTSIFYVSKEHFSRQFHHYVGKSFKEYLMAYRLYKAYDDVVSTSKPIQEIAYDHGFLNVKSFIKLFKETYLLTPLQYRKKISNK